MKLIKVEVTDEEKEIIEGYAKEEKISISKALGIILERGLKKAKSERFPDSNPNNSSLPATN